MKNLFLPVVASWSFYVAFSSFHPPTLSLIPFVFVQPPDLSFSHLHLYSETLESLSTYKEIESRLNAFHASKSSPVFSAAPADTAAGRATFLSTPGASIGQASKYAPQDRDVVKQLLAGVGYRVTGVYDGANTTSMLVTSKDPAGVQIVVTALKLDAPAGSKDQYGHFDAAAVRRFYKAHSNRPGIAALAFEVTSGNIEAIHNNYTKLHPSLLPAGAMSSYKDGSGTVTRVLEVRRWRGRQFVLCTRARVSRAAAWAGRSFLEFLVAVFLVSSLRS